MVALLDEAVLRDALAHAAAAVVIFNEDRRFLAVNDCYLELTGYSRDEVRAHLAGENLRLDPLDQEQFIGLITARISVGDADIVLKNGEPLALEYVVVPTTVAGKRLFIGMMWPLLVDGA